MTACVASVFIIVVGHLRALRRKPRVGFQLPITLLLGLIR